MDFLNDIPRHELIGYGIAIATAAVGLLAALIGRTRTVRHVYQPAPVGAVAAPKPKRKSSGGGCLLIIIAFVIIGYINREKITSAPQGTHSTGSATATLLGSWSGSVRATQGMTYVHWVVRPNQTIDERLQAGGQPRHAKYPYTYADNILEMRSNNGPFTRYALQWRNANQFTFRVIASSDTRLIGLQGAMERDR